MKKIISYLLILCLIFGTTMQMPILAEDTIDLPINVENQEVIVNKTGFIDTKGFEWAEDDIKYLVDKGVIGGIGNNKFAPDYKVTREELAKILTLAYNLKDEKPVEGSSFIDVDVKHWSSPYIEVIKKYLTGRAVDGGRIFQPKRAATREDVAMCLIRIIGIDIKNSTDKNYGADIFKDYKDINEDKQPYVSVAAKIGIINGYEDNTFRATDGINRAETAVIVRRALNYIENGTVYNTEDNEKLDLIKNYVKENYIGDTSLVDNYTGSIDGYFKELGDPYSQYFDADEYKEFMSLLSNNFTGIGVGITEVADGLKIVSTIEGAPAQRAGILANDIMTTINSKNIKSIGVNAAVKMLKGEDGKDINIQVKRENEKELLSFTLKAEKINVNSIETKILDKQIVYMSMSIFDVDTATEMDNAFAKIKIEEQKGLILDLRQNSGGYFDQALMIADKFLSNDLITYTKDKKGEKIEYKASEGKINIPIILLVDEKTASSAEILAGALKDHNIAKIVGVQTFGKGIVQDIIELTDGTAIKLTTKKYYTPNNLCPDKIGITPDIIIKAGTDNTKDLQLEKAISEMLLMIK